MDKTVEIVIIAMLAAFLALRLIAVLGRRAEHDEEPLQPRFETGDGTAAGALAGPALAPRPAAATRPPVPGVAPAIERGLREIIAADRRFDLLAFAEGAKGAYRQVLEAFWAGDKAALAPLCDPLVLASFAAAIDARAAAGETLDNRLVRIEEANIVAASYQAPMARITVRFVADIAAVTRNAGGEMIGGSLDDAIEVRDLWTFCRDTTQSAPDWLLDETDEG